MKLRCMIKTEKGWQKETPDDVSRWMWKHDGEEAIVLDETNPAAKAVYCGTPALMEEYREKWERERKPNDQRRAAMFYELDKLLFQQEEVK